MLSENKYQGVENITKYNKNDRKIVREWRAKGRTPVIAIEAADAAHVLAIGSERMVNQEMI